MIYNFDDSAELLGWYEVTYEDGFVKRFPYATVEHPRVGCQEGEQLQ